MIVVCVCVCVWCVLFAISGFKCVDKVVVGLYEGCWNLSVGINF